MLIITIMTAILALTLIGCTNAELDYEIHDDALIISYKVAIDDMNSDSQRDRILKSLEYYWKKQGFDVSKVYSGKNDPKTIQGKKVLTSSGIDESLLTLIDILTDKELSPFNEVKCTQENFFIFNIVHFNGLIDTQNIFKYDTTNKLPNDLLDKLSDSTDNSSLSISLTTSLKVKDSNADKILESDEPYRKYIWHMENNISNNISISFYIINYMALKLICSIIGIILASIFLIKLNKKINRTQYI